MYNLKALKTVYTTNIETPLPYTHKTHPPSTLPLPSYVQSLDRQDPKSNRDGVLQFWKKFSCKNLLKVIHS